MNKEWSEQNKAMQTQLRRESTFQEGICTLLRLRNSLMDVLTGLRTELSREDFNAMPYINADGFHSKSIAYSIWHIFRIEDIVAHTLIAADKQVFFAGDYQKLTGSPVVTTGNELVKEEIFEFSKKLNIDMLYSYIADVKISTEQMLKALQYSELKRKLPEETRENPDLLGVVSPDESAVWLIDYWCGKDIRGLIQMPFSRHWIMHTEAILRIKSKICR